MKILPNHQEKINGVLSTFDRIIFKGHLGFLYRAGNMSYFLNHQGILIKDFPAYAEKCTQKVKRHSKEIAASCGRPYIYHESPKTSKEQAALTILEKDPVEEGLICIIASVETCRAFTTGKDVKTGKIKIITQTRKCLYLYFYFMDKEFGFMNVRLQTWFPYEIQIYINGREYLSRLMDKAGLDYRRYDNSFLSISDIDKAQEIADKIPEKKWAPILDQFAYKLNPMLQKIKNIVPRGGYYWVLWQCEYATDVMFKDRESLKAIYPDLVEHATFSFSSDDVMTFLGRKLNSRFLGDLGSDMKRRPVGIRVKHRMKKNFIKMYDKFSVLRIETIINDPYEFKIYGEITEKGQAKMGWKPMGKGVSNIYRYAGVSKAANLRYLDCLAQAADFSQSRKQLDTICRAVEKEGKRYTALNPLSPECIRWFKAILYGGNTINGFSNKTIREQLFPWASLNSRERKKTTGKVSRLLRKLRAHRLIAKIPRTFRYRVTKEGAKVMPAVLKIHRTEFHQAVATF